MMRDKPHVTAYLLNDNTQYVLKPHEFEKLLNNFVNKSDVVAEYDGIYGDSCYFRGSMIQSMGHWTDAAIAVAEEWRKEQEAEERLGE